MAKVHAKRSALKASVWKARLRSAGDVLLIIAAVGAALLITLRWPRLLGDRTLLFAWIAAGVLTAVLVWRCRTNWHTSQVRLGGSRGEDLALRQVKAALPDSYALFTNLTVNVGKYSSETDLVAVGPGGVTVVEVKNYSGVLSGRAGDRRLTHSNERHTETPYNPIQQVSTHVRRLGEYLAFHGQRVPVRGMVFFVNPRLSVCITDKPEFPFFTADQLTEMVEQIKNGRSKLSQAQVRAIVELLDRA